MLKEKTDKFSESMKASRESEGQNSNFNDGIKDLGKGTDFVKQGLGLLFGEKPADTYNVVNNVFSLGSIN